MKIIIVGPAHPYRGGISAFGERLANEYKREGDDVEMYTFTLQYPSFLFPGKTQYSDSPAPEGLSITRRINSVNPFNWISVGREIAKKRPDLLITNFWLPFMAPCQGTIERIVRRNGHTRVVALLHNIIPHEHRPGDRILSRYFVRSTQSFVAMSKAVLEDLNIFDKKKPRAFCPHPLYDHYGELIAKEEARHILGLDPNDRYVLFFGFIRAYKGLDLLLEAMGDSRVREAGIKLIVAGEFYGDSKPYMEQIERLGIKDSTLLFTEFIPDDKVNLYFRACDIVVQPYKSATQSGVAQIAFHFEKPMIVTNVGGLAEIVPDGKVGYVVEPQPGQIADAIIRYFDGNHEQEFTEGVREEKKKYSWSKMRETINHN
ncbi:MAG: glycosyltransferase [Bacteroidales bacterium]|nr:glycosyltransferase [Bacteroidales bacterium]